MASFIFSANYAITGTKADLLSNFNEIWIKSDYKYFFNEVCLKCDSKFAAICPSGLTDLPLGYLNEILNM